MDEIQVCERAITALKFIAQDDRFDCIASGTNLKTTFNRTDSFPVGYIDRLEMNSLDFEEYLWASGMSEEAINYLKDDFIHNNKVNDTVHKKLMELFKEYIVIGGMPNVVDEFIKTHNFNIADKMKKNIIEDIKMI